MLDSLFQQLEALYPELVEIRRDLHMNPELSFKEERTPQKIAEYLESLGLEVTRNVGGNGVVAWLRGKKPGRTAAFRADFDALPIQDEKEVSYKSQVPGVMHACGHDIHTAALLGAAKVLSGCREQIHGNIVFIHQFAEEVVPGGAKAMIADGCLDGVDVIYGAHVWSEMPVGTIGCREGYGMAAMDAFEIEIFGKGGHGAFPHLTVDPLVIGSQLVLNLQQIVSRRVNPLQPAVVTVGTFSSGQAYNIIPDSARMTGTVRTFDQNTRDLIERSIHDLAQAACEGAGARFEHCYDRGYPPVCSHAREVQDVRRAGERIVGSENVVEFEPMMGGEDFAYYLEQIPGAFFVVGGRNPELKAIYPHHHPKFDVDERSMLVIGKIFLHLAFQQEEWL